MERKPKIRVGIVGAAGRMGRIIAQGLHRATDMDLVLAVDREHADESLRDVIGPHMPDVPIRSKLGEALDETPVQVIVDFTHPSAACQHALSALKRHVAPIIGTSGLTSDDLKEIRRQAEESGTPAMVVPNFAIGAVLMMKFAETAAKYMPDVEIIEMHHDGKADAPSGTALRTAELITQNRRAWPTENVAPIIKLAGARGANLQGVQIHSIRLKGMLAHQQVVFGGDGEILTIRHDSLDRSSFVEGVTASVRAILGRTGLTVGLEAILDN
ncbi:MAG: 4-hydroxy-tetrahydrodipicolinate reductase [Fimbriimonadaceae bacterium]|nr:4-hydroxy-tetrahydrodipicolinate reductase [Fimbriimonadaceae bacterium]